MNVNVLMVSPEFYRIEYAINPHMSASDGGLPKVNFERASTQWSELKATYERLGCKVHVLGGHKEFPDMVFAANQTFPFVDPRTGVKRAIQANMKNLQRQAEPPYFRKFFEAQGYAWEVLETAVSFEGCGDAALLNTSEILGGIGPRTDASAYDEIEARFNLKVHRLYLVDPYCYHLDTCLCILNPTTVAIQPSAFDNEGKTLIRRLFENVVEVPRDENLEFFCCNAHSVDGVNVVMQRGSPSFAKNLERLGFRPQEVDTSEFILAGGSVFCLKMQFV